MTGRATAEAVQTFAETVGTLLRQTRLLRGQRIADVAEGIGRAGSVIDRVELARQDADLVMLITLSVHFGVRLSNVLRPAEDTAFPDLDGVWTDNPHRYLGRSVAEDPDSIVLALLGTNPAAPPDGPHLVVHDVALLVRRARTRRHLRAADLGRACGVGATVISRLELARKAWSLSRLVTACVYVRVRPSDVVRLAEDHAFPYPAAVWTDHSRRRVAWLRATTRHATSHQATREGTARPAPTPTPTPTPQGLVPPAARVWCLHYAGEISVELRHGQPIEIVRCVACGEPIPAPTAAQTAALHLDEVAR
ncbi:MAG TPA: hypothetical protein VFW65_29250 [Pseudonocardiaceae bacterium]|nr:hypothetical protein [Pseudonocardiaceae bacterium]